MIQATEPTLDHSHPKIIEVAFSFPEFVNKYKKSVYSIIFFLRYSQICPTLFNQLLIFMNLYQYVKNQAISSFCSKDTDVVKILQSDWLRTFRPISQKPDFSQVRDLRRNVATQSAFTC